MFQILECTMITLIKRKPLYKDQVVYILQDTHSKSNEIKSSNTNVFATL